MNFTKIFKRSSKRSTHSKDSTHPRTGSDDNLLLSKRKHLYPSQQQLETAAQQSSFLTDSLESSHNHHTRHRQLSPLSFLSSTGRLATKTSSTILTSPGKRSEKLTRHHKFWSSLKSKTVNHFRSKSSDKTLKKRQQEDQCFEFSEEKLRKYEVDLEYDLTETASRFDDQTDKESFILSKKIRLKNFFKLDLKKTSSSDLDVRQAEEDVDDVYSTPPCNEDNISNITQTNQTTRQISRSVSSCRRDNDERKSYVLQIYLREGKDLVVRDRCGTSDPYVKFKYTSKTVYKSKVVERNLNPTWNERLSLRLRDLVTPILVQVYDRDVGMVTDDYMGEAIIEPDSLNVDQETEMNLMLTDGKKSKKFKYMGYLLLQCKLTFGIRNLFDNKLLSNARSNSSSSIARSFFLGDHQRKKKKKQKIKGSVNIVLVEGRQLIAMDDNGFSDPYVKFQLGNEKFKSKCKLKTLNPKWVETFDIDWLESDQSYLDINVYDHDVGGKDDVLGRAKLDLTSYEPNRTHNLKVDLEDGGGYLILLLTICPFDRNDDEVDSGQQQQQKVGARCEADDNESGQFAKIIDCRDFSRKALEERYSIYRSFQDISDVGHLVLTIHQARGLAAADIGGKSDPFCLVELVNTRLQTHTDFKTLNPKWGKEFYIQVTDIHSVLEITVLDYDKNKKSEFLGKVAIPLLRIENDRRKWYALKDKKLQQPSKGSIEIQGTLYYNHVKAVYRTMHPREDKIILPDATFKLTTMKTNIDRVFKLVEGFVSSTNFINSCFNWDNPLRSLLAFIVFMLIVWNIELYMVPISLLLILLKNFLVLQFSGEYFKEQIPQEYVEQEKKEAESSNKDDKKSQSLRERLQNIQDVCLQVQETMDAVASLGERIQNAFLWKVPWLSTLGIICLCVATCVFYCLSLRVLLMIWGVLRFSRRWRVGQKVPNNELLDFLSRLPSNKELLEQREILNKFSTSATTNNYDFPVTSANTTATT